MHQLKPHAPPGGVTLEIVLKMPILLLSTKVLESRIIIKIGRRVLKYKDKEALLVDT